MTFYEQYKTSKFCNAKILSPEFLEDLGAKLLDYAYHADGSKGFVNFIAEMGIPYRTFHYWIGKYPELKEDYEQAKLMFGENLQANALKRKFDAALSKYILYHYLPEYKEIQQFLAKMRDLSDTEEARTKVVLIENLAEAASLIEDPEKMFKEMVRNEVD
jgi:hypothetical protein